MSGALSDEVFQAYMVHSKVPAWARHYARRIRQMDELDGLNDNDPDYHRYDCEYYKAVPLGARRLMIAVFCLAFVLCGAIFISFVAPNTVPSVLPPYFNENELTPAKPNTLRGS